MLRGQPCGARREWPARPEILLDNGASLVQALRVVAMI